MRSGDMTTMRRAERITKAWRRPGLPAAGFALFCLLPFPGTHAQTQRQIGRYTVTEQPVGAWVLKASAGPLGPYCTVERRGGGQTFGYQVTRTGQRYFGLSSATWKRAPGSFAAVRLTAGGAVLWSGRAIAPVPDSLVLPMQPGQRDPAAILSRVESAQVEISDQALRFDLSGAAEALRAQRTCLAEAR